MKKRITIQLWTAVVLTMSGIVLLFCGFWVFPVGEISNSVLVAFGEVSTFAGGLFGLDYTYKFKYKDLSADMTVKDDEEEAKK